MTITGPCGSQANSSLNRSWVAGVIWIFPGSPWLSMRLAVLT